MPPLNKLTKTEALVIENKETEAPFSGEYDNFYAKGIYLCRRCDAPLYRSCNKFNAGCGWPSFDDEINGAVKQVLDTDGRRIEIICKQCLGHLGHVFHGEELTSKNTRHCVNSLSIRFLPFEKLLERALILDDQLDVAVIAGGCFWGVDYFFEIEPAVLITACGYSGGITASPTYEQVCTGKTKHAEAVAVIYDKSKTTLEHLYDVFFEIHDATQLNRQGPDKGTQYRSAIFYNNDEQKQIANKKIDALKAKGIAIITEVLPLKKFWIAENCHQSYFSLRNELPSCHFRRGS